MIKLLEKRYRQIFPKQLRTKKLYQNLLKDLTGIEIGGPSSMFSAKGLLPIYDCISALDGVNFSNETMWEGKLQAGQNYNYNSYKSKNGYQYISEGEHLPFIENGKYDFVLSCHNLEHLANPLKAVDEWKRIIKDNGYILIVLPHKDLTFDRKRNVTLLRHLIDDYDMNTAEDDTTHFEEVLALHDISLDYGFENQQDFELRVKNNLTHRGVHHHVFDTKLVAEMIDNRGLQIIQLDVMYHNIFVIAQKKEAQEINNQAFTNLKKVAYSGKSTYPSDELARNADLKSI